MMRKGVRTYKKRDIECSKQRHHIQEKPNIRANDAELGFIT